MQGQLLIAHPLLHDGFFNRSVVYLTNHNSEGAIGFSLNFKTQFLLKDVRPQVKNGSFQIFEGGPVAKNQLFFLHTLGHDLPDSFPVANNIFVGGDFDELMRMIDKGLVKNSDVRFFAGYSGWSENQLEEEIENKHWLLHEPDNASFLTYEPDDLWGIELTEIKNSYSIFADFGSDPCMN